MDDLTQQFFREGVRYYVKTLRVFDRYEKMIQEIAKSALSKKLSAFSNAMGAGSLGPITSYPPEREELSSGYAGTGVYTAVPGCGRCYVMAYVYDDNKMTAVVSFYLDSAKQTHRIMEATNAMPGREKMLIDNSPEWEVYAEKPLSEVNTEALAIAMENLLEVWISFWGKVGGIQKLFSKK